MLKKRLIACLIWADGMIVQSIGFRHTNVVGNAITAVDFFNTWAVDEILLLNASRNDNTKESFLGITHELSKRCFVPLSVGGYVKSVDDVRGLLERGADKVVVNSHAFRNPQFITEAAKRFGNQCIVISIDAKIVEGKHIVHIDRGREYTGIDAKEWALRAEKCGAGEIFLTSIDNDGARNGYDLKLTREVSEAVEIPVIASGGVGKWEHLVAGITEGKADALSAANIFHYSEQSTKNAKEFMKNAGLDVREIVFYKARLPRRPRYEV